MQYRSNRKTLPVIGRELAVDMILEGSITTHGNRVRIIAQLIDARSDEHLWTALYDRLMEDVLALQADVAGAIAKGVQEVLKGMPGTPGGDRRTLPVTVPKPLATSGSSPSPAESPSSVSPARPVQ